MSPALLLDEPLTFAKLGAAGIALVGVVPMTGRRTLGATQRAATAKA